MEPFRSPSPTTIDGRYRLLLVLWLAFLCFVGVYFLVTTLIERPANTDSSAGNALSFVFSALGAFATIFSFMLKQKLLSQSVERQRPGLVQTAYIVALALCEVVGLLGLVLYLITGERYYYLLFIVALIGMLIHMPRRDHFLAASIKESNLRSHNDH